jgi:PPOX class probable F420-dependent enzyme
VRQLTPAHRAFLENPFIAVVTTLRSDGSPHSTPVWVDVDDEGVSVNTAWPRTKPRNLAADPRMSLVVVDPNDELRWLAITGTTTVTEDGANEQIDRLARKYRGHERFMSHREGETRVTVRISPTFVESRGID